MIKNEEAVKKFAFKIGEFMIEFNHSEDRSAVLGCKTSNISSLGGELQKLPLNPERD